MGIQVKKDDLAESSVLFRERYSCTLQFTNVLYSYTSVCFELQSTLRYSTLQYISKKPDLQQYFTAVHVGPVQRGDSADLVIDRLMYEDEGNYECRAANSVNKELLETKSKLIEVISNVNLSLSNCQSCLTAGAIKLL